MGIVIDAECHDPDVLAGDECSSHICALSDDRNDAGEDAHLGMWARNAFRKYNFKLVQMIDAQGFDVACCL